MKNEYFAEELNGKLISIFHHGMAVQVQLVETGELIPNVMDLMVYSYDGLMAQVKLSHWYEPEERYYFEIANCCAQFA